MALTPDEPKVVCTGMADLEENAEAIEAASESNYKRVGHVELRTRMLRPVTGSSDYRLDNTVTLKKTLPSNAAAAGLTIALVWSHKR